MRGHWYRYFTHPARLGPTELEIVSYLITFIFIDILYLTPISARLKIATKSGPSHLSHSIMFTFVIWSAAFLTGQSFSAKHTRPSSLVAGLRALKFPRLQKATMVPSRMTLQWLNGEGFLSRLQRRSAIALPSSTIKSRGLLYKRRDSSIFTSGSLR